jgi:hypothetical protein
MCNCRTCDQYQLRMGDTYGMELEADTQDRTVPSDVAESPIAVGIIRDGSGTILALTER